MTAAPPARRPLVPPPPTRGAVDHALGLADDALVASHRLAEWVTNAPQLEEDVALGNVALDLLGQARSLLSHAGALEGLGRDEDELAYWRDDRHYRNVVLVERPDEDFAVAVVRLLALSTYQLHLYRELLGSADAVLAGVAGKAVKEVAYHRDHAAQWVLRLGDGTDESHRRAQAGLDRVWPYVDELFDSSWVDPALLADGTAVDAAALRPAWEADVREVLGEATLAWPEVARMRTDGRRGVHSEALGHLLAEMQHLHRSHPGATW